MTLEVGTNCYTDIAEANEIIDSYFDETDPIRKYWDSIIDDNNKSAIILGTTHKYDRDSMFYKGFKKEKNQNMQFPRINEYGGITECPLDIKLGLLIQGIRTAISNKSSEYSELKAQGIKEYKIKDADVEFFEHIDLEDIDTIKMSSGMYKIVYDTYFTDWTDLIN